MLNINTNSKNGIRCVQTLNEIRRHINLCQHQNLKHEKINTILPKSPNIHAIKLPEQKKETDTKCCK